MISKILVAASFASLMATTAFAADALRPAYVPTPSSMVSGDLSAGFGTLQFDDGGEGLYSFGARANVPLGTGAWNVEAEVNGLGIFYGDGGDPALADGYIHLWNRNPGSAWGLFTGTSFGGGRVTSLGAEFKHYLPDMSYGAAGAVLFGDGNGTGWLGSAYANYYFNPNHRIGLVATVIGGNNNATLWSVTADFEHRLNQPFGLWASLGVSGASYNNGNPWTALGGFRIYLDRPGSTIQSHEMDVPFAVKLPTASQQP